MRRTDFKRSELFEDVICSLDYAESVVASFAHQIQPWYYGENRSVSIEVIALENFIACTKNRYQFKYTITETSCSVSLFLPDDIKQDADTTIAHRKHLISLLK